MGNDMVLIHTFRVPVQQKLNLQSCWYIPIFYLMRSICYPIIRNMWSRWRLHLECKFQFLSFHLKIKHNLSTFRVALYVGMIWFSVFRAKNYPIEKWNHVYNILYLWSWVPKYCRKLKNIGSKKGTWATKFKPSHVHSLLGA